MLVFSGTKETVAQFVCDLVVISRIDLASIMIITPARSEVCYALCAIDTSWEDIVVRRAQIYSWLPTDISRVKAILDGLSLPK